VTSTTNVAVAGGIYGAGELADSREQLFQQVEEEWADLRLELMTQGDLSADRRSLLALFAAFQLTRTLKHCNQNNFIADVAATTADRPISKDAVRQYIHSLDGFDPTDNEVEAAWTYVNAAPGIPAPDEMLSISMQVAVQEIAPRLESMTWTVRKFRDPVLRSSDSPVQAWHRPTADSDLRGIGVGNADEVRFPLSPTALLVMEPMGRQPSPASARRLRAINAEICRQCHQFVIAVLQAKFTLDQIDLLDPPPRVRFATGPGYSTSAGAAGEYIGEVFQMYVK
jgi:hypothetical protein